MPNRNLTTTELAGLFAPLIADVRGRLLDLAAGGEDLHWALRRKLAKELTYDERSKPMQRRALKVRKRAPRADSAPNAVSHSRIVARCSIGSRR